MTKIPVDPSQATRLINHGPTVLVSCGQKTPNILTVAWTMPVGRTQKDSLVALSIAPSHHSYGLILKEREFAVNIPGADLLDKLLLCGSTSGKETDKFREAKLTPARGSAISVPLIRECLGHLECTLEAVYEEPDYHLIIGRVVAASVLPEAFDGTWNLEEKEHRTIHHLGGKYFTFPERRFVV